MNKILVAILGKAGSGKDSLIAEICRTPKFDFNKIIPYTTRPKRDYEKEGNPYHFVTNEEFAELVLNGEMIEATIFNNWAYGTTKSSLSGDINIGAYNPEAYDCLSIPPEGITILPYYIVCDDKLRMLRQLNREEEPNVHEIARRFLADDEDFVEIEANNNIPVLENNTWQDCYDNASKIIQDVASLSSLDHNI